MPRTAGSSLTFDLTERLGRQIIAGVFPPGATLPNEAEICASLDVGRSAVREAVKMLTAKGLVESRPRRGTQVLPYGAWNVFDRDVLAWLRDEDPDPLIIAELLQLRIGVEPIAAKLATENGTDADVAAIAAAYDKMCQAGLGRADPVSADAAFHEAIIAATHNRFFQPFGPLIRTALSVTAATTNMIFGHSVGDLPAHKAVLDAIAARDAELARAKMEAMLTEVARAVLAWHRGEWTGGPPRPRAPGRH